MRRALAAFFAIVCLLAPAALAGKAAPAKHPAGKAAPARHPAGKAGPAKARAGKPKPRPGMKIGVNVMGGNNYNCDNLITSDLMYQAGWWGAWQMGKVRPPMRPDGYPAYIDATTGSCNSVVGLNSRLPAGRYVLTAQGKGVVWVNLDGWKSYAFDGTGRSYALDTPNARKYGTQITVGIGESNPADPIHKISLYMPGADPSTPFNPALLENLKNFSFLRFMDWGVTNNSPIVSWNQLRPEQFSFSAQGQVPYELWTELCNELNKDCWVCIPYHADDDYVVQMARYLDERLEYGRGIYIEYSNEIWNWGFQQGQDSIAEYKAAQPPGGLWAYQGRRAAQKINVFRSALTTSRPCVRVIGAQAGWVGAAKETIQAARTAGGFDAIACAPYFNHTLTNAKLGALAGLFNAGDSAARVNAVGEVLASCNASIEEYTGYLAEWRRMANQDGVSLLLYECGQHLANPSAPEWDALLAACNRDPRMGDLYRSYIKALREVGVDAACFYADVSPYNKWGYWGLKEYTAQPAAEAPKWRAVIDATLGR